MRQQGTIPGSDALSANLVETRSEIVIPSEYQVLTDAVGEYFGVHKAVTELLNEHFHPYRNLADVARRLRELSGGMLHHFERSPEHARCIDLLGTLFDDLYRARPDGEELRGLVGSHLRLLSALAESPHRADYASQIVDGVLAVDRELNRSPAVVLQYSGPVRRLLRKVSDLDGAADATGHLYRDMLRLGVRTLAVEIDVAGWAASQDQETSTACSDVVEVVGELIAEGERSALGGADELWDAPNLDELLTRILTAAGKIDDLASRVALYLHLAAVPALGYRTMEILRAVSFTLREAGAEGNLDKLARTVRLICAQIRRTRSRHKQLLYGCLQKLATEIARRHNHRLVDEFVDEVIASGFEGPDIRGVSEEWQVAVNPNHLPCVRCWLGIIRTDPVQYERLLSALTVNLFFRGLFVSDTDLFQRDISALLGADIGGSFQLVMQLVPRFPVFFHQIGAEGELREVSTKIDQVLHRRDPVIHFLRKQSHAESNNRLVGFTRAVYHYWRTGRTDDLAPHLPDDLLAELSTEEEGYPGVRAATRHLEAELGFTEDHLGERSLDELQSVLTEAETASEVDRERTVLLIRMHRLLAAKYSYSPEQVLPMLAAGRLVSADLRQEFTQAVESNDAARIVAVGNQVLLALKERITADSVEEAREDLYRKRHIAAGIPSLYGSYHEPRFDAMGAMIRCIRFLQPHLERCVQELGYRYVTRESLRRACALMGQMLIGLRISGLRVRNLEAQVGVLERVAGSGTFSAGQYLNVLEFITEAFNDLVEANYIALHGPNLPLIARQVLEVDEATGATGAEDSPRSVDEGIDRLSEAFLRDAIASTYALQELDVLLGALREALRAMARTLSDRTCDHVLSFTPSRLISFIHDPLRGWEDQLHLGAKGHALKRLKDLGLPVPHGFIISTELFRVFQAVRYPELRQDVAERVSTAVGRLEELTGARLGDPVRPLVLSVRSGSAFSMPGMMDTILNVGITEEIAEAMPRHGYDAWGGWDSYRRYLQNVAMSHGVERNRFDEIMLRFKDRHGVPLKIDFTAEQMREMTLEYRRVGTDAGVAYRDDPLGALMQAVYLVLSSWESETARVYRRQMQVSDDWGTGAIVQQMVFGNRRRDAGSGVAFTRAPGGATTGISLFGDFTMCSQGEDVVGGLVSPYPASEKQRLRFTPRLDVSLEKDFPEIYGRLHEIAEQLVHEERYEHQEIEFTFESPAAEDLFILQTRPMRLVEQRGAPTFARPEEMASTLVGTGIGISGGALSGSVAFSHDDVDRLRREKPDRPLILLRPDTVPEDIGLVLAVDGLLTARGGATSHAAVTAKRIGKCCVVNLRDLIVSETERVARIRGHALRAGDSIAIDGRVGAVYLGDHPVAERDRPRMARLD